MFNSYYENGVVLIPNVVAEGTKASIVYKGILKNSGADSVYMHIGYGSGWEQNQFIKMDRDNEGFKASVPVTSQDVFNVAFKDSANNWDNNSGNNYSFEVQTR